jgi:hypothetical protein
MDLSMKRGRLRAIPAGVWQEEIRKGAGGGWEKVIIRRES